MNKKEKKYFIEEKKIIDKNLLGFKSKGIKRSKDKFGYSFDDLSERDLFFKDLGYIQIINKLLGIKDSIENIKWKKQQGYKLKEL